MRTVIGFVLICVVNAGDWTYKGHFGAAEWKDHFEKCGGSSQSPIDLDPEGSECVKEEARPVTSFSGSFLGSALNNGHTIQVNVPDGTDDNPRPNVTIGNDGYDVLQFHFHWGSDPTHKGSEHTEKGKHHQMELHVVTKQQKGNGLAVLGFFIDETEGEDNGAFKSLVSNLESLKTGGATQENVRISLRALVAPAITSHFYRYRGSLTTPPCSETVLWTVYQKPLEISKAQLDAFYKTGITDNYRPTLPLKGRKLHNSAKC